MARPSGIYWGLGFLMTLLLVAGLTACGGGGETEPAPTSAGQATAAPASPTMGSPTATMTAEELNAAEALLKAAVLRPEDVPEGLLLEDEGFTTNEQLGELGDVLVKMFYSASGVALEDRFDSMGRILGYHANYKADTPSDLSSFSGRVSLSVSVDLYRDSLGPHTGLELSPQHLLDEKALRENLQEFYEALGMELRDLSLSSPSFAEVGDERVAREMKVTVRAPDLDTDFHVVLQWVYIQRDRLFASLMMITVNASPPVEELEDLARTLDERMKDALD